MASRTTFKLQGSPHRRDIILSGKYKVGASGAIDVVVEDADDQTSEQDAGFTVSHAGTGRYTVAFYRTFRSVKAYFVNMSGPASAAFPTTTGIDPQFRGTPTASGATLQFTRQDTMADAVPASGTWGQLLFLVSESE